MYLLRLSALLQFIFPGGCCPSLGSLTDALAKNCTLQLHGVDSFALHYGETLRRWRANFNAVLDEVRERVHHFIACICADLHALLECVCMHCDHGAVADKTLA